MAGPPPPRSLLSRMLEAQQRVAVPHPVLVAEPGPPPPSRPPVYHTPVLPSPGGRHLPPPTPPPPTTQLAAPPPAFPAILDRYGATTRLAGAKRARESDDEDDADKAGASAAPIVISRGGTPEWRWPPGYNAPDKHNAELVRGTRERAASLVRCVRADPNYRLAEALVYEDRNVTDGLWRMSIAAEFGLEEPMVHLATHSDGWPFASMVRRASVQLEAYDITWALWIALMTNYLTRKVALYPPAHFNNYRFYTPKDMTFERVADAESTAAGYPLDINQVRQSPVTVSLAVPQVRLALFPIHDPGLSHWVLVAAYLTHDDWLITSVQLAYYDSINRAGGPFVRHALAMVETYIRQVVQLSMQVHDVDPSGLPPELPIFHPHIAVWGGQEVHNGDGWSCGYYVIQRSMAAMSLIKRGVPPTPFSIDQGGLPDGPAVADSVADYVVRQTEMWLRSMLARQESLARPEYP